MDAEMTDAKMSKKSTASSCAVTRPRPRLVMASPSIAPLQGHRAPLKGPRF